MATLEGGREGGTRASLAGVFFFISPIYFLAPATQATKWRGSWEEVVGRGTWVWVNVA